MAKGKKCGTCGSNKTNKSGTKGQPTPKVYIKARPR